MALWQSQELDLPPSSPTEDLRVLVNMKYEDLITHAKEWTSQWGGLSYWSKYIQFQLDLARQAGLRKVFYLNKDFTAQAEEGYILLNDLKDRELLDYLPLDSERRAEQWREHIDYVELVAGGTAIISMLVEYVGPEEYFHKAH